MGSGEALKAAKVYRELMKAVKKHIGKEEHKTHFSDFIKSEFRKNGDGYTCLYLSFKQCPSSPGKEDGYGIECVLSIDNDDKAQKLLHNNAAKCVQPEYFMI